LIINKNYTEMHGQRDIKKISSLRLGKMSKDSISIDRFWRYYLGEKKCDFITEFLNTQMETIHRKTSRKTQVPVGRRCQERLEEDETHKMDRTSPRSSQMERNCWEGQDSTRVIAPSKKKMTKFLWWSVDMCSLWLNCYG